MFAVLEELFESVFAAANEMNIVTVQGGEDALRVDVPFGDIGKHGSRVEIFKGVAGIQDHLVLEGEEASDDAVKPQQARVGHGDLADEEFLGGSGGFELCLVGVEPGFEFGWVFAG